MPVPIKLSARIFVSLLAVVAAFQLCLALGLPWGSFAMGGAYPGVYPPEMRIAALVQIPLLALVGAVVLSRAGLAMPSWAPASRWLIWLIVALFGVAVILNLITPSEVERMIWAPVAIILFATALHVAVATRAHRVSG